MKKSFYTLFVLCLCFGCKPKQEVSKATAENAVVEKESVLEKKKESGKGELIAEPVDKPSLKLNQTTPETPSREPQERTKDIRIRVSFFSRGAGINSEAYREFEYLLEKFGSGCKLDFDVKPWGREGERDFCFKMNNDCNERFVYEVNHVMKNKDRVRITENTFCRP